MDVKDQSTPTIPSGHESHGVHLCHRCGWPFPNPHPSARHRRAHKKICGTIEGYTNLIDSGVVSDDEHHPDEDKEKTPSPKIEKKKSINESGGGGIGGRSSRSEDDMFSDAVTEFSDSGTSSGVEDRSVGNRDSNKTLDRDLFFSFKDAENGGTDEVLNSPIEISKVDASLKVSEKLDTHVEKIGEAEITTVCDSSEAKLELPETNGKCSDGLGKDGVIEATPGQSDVSQSQEAESIDFVKVGEEKVKETRTSETDEHAVPTTITEEAKDAYVQASEMIKTTPESVVTLIEAEVSVTTGLPGYDDNAEQENSDKLSDVAIGDKLEAATQDGISEEIKHEKFESDCEHLSAVVKESEIDHGAEGISEEIKHEKFELYHEHAPEVVKESEIDQRAEEVGEEIKHEKFEIDAPEVVKESDQKAEGVGEKIKHEKFESDHEHASEVVKEPETDQSVSVLTEREDLGALKLEKCSKEVTWEVVKEPDTVLTEKEDLGAPNLEKRSNEHTQEVVKEPDSVLLEKEDLGAPNLKCSKEHSQEVVEEPGSVLSEKEDLGAPNMEKCSEEHSQEVVEEPKVDKDSNVVADVSVGMITLKEAEQSAKDLERASDNSVAIDDTRSITYGKNASGVVSEPIVEGNGKLMTNQDSGVDLSVDSSSRNSLEGNWGSVSVLSTASIDAETLHTSNKSKVNSGKSVAADSNLGTSDVFEPPSFMTLVEPKGEDQKSAAAAAASSEVQDSQQQPKSKAPQVGWFPTLTNVSNESEGRKRNEEVIAKVTNWSTGKHSTPLKNLLSEAKSPNSKQPVTVVQKDEAANEKLSLLCEDPAVNQDLSPPKPIDDGKKTGKKVKGRGSWVPFACCSSVNVVN